MKTIKSRIILSILVAVGFNLGVILILGTNTISDALYEAEINHAKNILHSAIRTVETGYKSIQFFRNEILEMKKENLKNQTELLIAFIREHYDRYKRGIISEQEAKKIIIRHIKNLRYDEGVGYFWINDTSRPFAKMIMHPTIPNLDGKVLDDPKFNCALGKKENLFNAFVDTVLQQRSGFVDYLWPKPTKKGLTSIQPKISYVTLFKEWNWVVGTGVYIDDVDTMVEKRVDSVIEDLSEVFKETRIGKTGYLFLFSGDLKMLVHPVFKNVITTPNPATGNNIMADLKEAAGLPEPMEYLWNKPGVDKNNFIFKKLAFVEKFDPLDWYIGSTVYIDDIKQSGSDLVRKVLVISAFAFLVSLVIVVHVSKITVKPLFILMDHINRIRKENFTSVKVPEEGTVETVALGQTINRMISSVTMSDRLVKEQEEVYLKRLEQTVEERTNELIEKNSELETNIEEMIKMRKKMVAQEKLASLGILSAGIAHEIKNPLNLINNAALIIQDLISKRGDIPEDLKAEYRNMSHAAEIIYNHGDKANTIVQTMLRQSRTGSEKMTSEDVGKVVRGGVNLAFHSMRTRYPFNLKMDIDQEFSCFLKVNHEEFERAIINICENSLFELHKKLREKGKSFKPKLEVKFEKNDHFIKIFIRDNGPGISEENLELIFNPFFTTKPTGEGTGLGLSLTNDIIMKHKGEISVQSKLNEYTEFVITLPILGEDE